jgi:hypothetical protein
VRKQHKIAKKKETTNHNASHHERHVQHQRFLQVSIIFRLEHISMTDFAAAAHLGAKLGQMSFLLVFWEEPWFFLEAAKGSNVRKEVRVKHKEQKASSLTSWLRHLLGQKMTPRQGKPSCIPVS